MANDMICLDHSTRIPRGLYEGYDSRVSELRLVDEAIVSADDCEDQVEELGMLGQP